jgi:hypothetical protein
VSDFIRNYQAGFWEAEPFYVYTGVGHLLALAVVFSVPTVLASQHGFNLHSEWLMVLKIYD